MTDKQFKTGEEYVKLEITRHPKVTGRRYSNDVIKVMTGLVYHMLITKGWSRYAIKDYIEKEWGVGKLRSNAIIDSAIDQLADVGDLDGKRNILLERLEDLYGRCLETNNLREAIKILEQMSKVYGLTQERIIVTDNMKFHFGDEQMDIKQETEEVSLDEVLE